jgi:hypothetical protein
MIRNKIASAGQAIIRVGEEIVLHDFELYTYAKSAEEKKSCSTDQPTLARLQIKAGELLMGIAGVEPVLRELPAKSPILNN